jgi:Skp family chaperone for outer membrane proteins
MLTFVMFIAFASVAAQPATQQKPTAPATQTRPQTPPAQSTTVNVPVGKVAVIFSAAFQDPKLGIARFSVLLNKLNAEFQAPQTELNQTAQKIKQLQDEISKLQQGSAVLTPAQIQAKIDQLDQLKKDYQRKGEDAQAAYQRRRQEIFAPLQDEVGKALDAYAKAHGIMLIIDGSQVEGILFAAESTDITKAFISDFNLKNPATASVTTPK